jgi:pyruvate dehydrogenase E2 component (dihydrolipoamide acetyltransferase)
MAHSWSTIPHVTHADKADITALEALRQRTAKRVEAQGTRLTVTVFLLKVIAEALRRFPKFNASVDIEHQRTVFKHYYHIGVAVDTPNGLLVPVVRDVDKKSIIDLAKEVAELAEKARNRRLGLEEMQGGTFTISNLGGLGGTHFTPIINAPEVAILGVSRAAYEPVFLQGQFVPRLMLPLALSYDHRLIDGAEAARFLRWVCETLEQPWALWLEA